ncbi:SnoaL-like polyketide cyclase [Maioricimonas rarisocia]|uniref:SnoaL-like polyketide cyclase n=1 Tax=Maioricimonas rarisocia TaxID=2528026 RepID=A0A517Z925_9PLAN|nr:ester cyclase [Maioricimonas rarisocia]QDU38975.1 SnoaL-like polyketide cyclase [Maioricimonas rarisocia]
MNNDNVARSLRWFEEVWNQRRTETIDELLTDESCGELEGATVRGPKEFKEHVHAQFLAAFPDLKFTVEGTVAEGDEVVIRWRATGTHQGDGLGLKATGQPISFRGMTWQQFRDGKLVGGWDCWNQEALMSKLRAAGG